MTEELLKTGERIDQLFSNDVKIIQNKDVFLIQLIVFYYHDFQGYLLEA